MKKIGFDAAHAAEFCIPFLLAACAANPTPVPESPQAAPESAPTAESAVPAAASAVPVASTANSATPVSPQVALAADTAPAKPSMAAPTTAAVETEQHEPYFDKFGLYETSLTGGVHIDADCKRVWDVMTTIDLLRKWAPHLNLTAINGQKTATQRGDAVNFKVDRLTGTVTGQFVLASPVPYHRVQAVVVPQKGNWVRIQEWNMIPEGTNKCRVDYNEAYNELWVRAQGIQGTGFISKVRDHHIHVVLRRMKNLAEGKEAGPPEELTYLLEDAKTFPDKLRVTAK